MGALETRPVVVNIFGLAAGAVIFLFGGVGVHDLEAQNKEGCIYDN
ncbi:MAG: hypothetical protein BAJALOKI2v1_960005 [Promethearchaeota archaeon]|nr:MAG: hypothetical protein BAJALOKI2v1_960005 [Candidatus Lokiarchaeota archaeon]